MKKKHTFRDVPLTVIPYYDDFEELEEKRTKTFDYSGDYSIDPLVMDYVVKTQELDKKFHLNSMKFDKQTSRFHYTKEFDDPKDAAEFRTELRDYLQSFVRKEVKIPNAIFEKVKETVERERDKFEGVDYSFYGTHVYFVGEKKNVEIKSELVYTMLDKFSDEAKKESVEVPIEDNNKLEFLNNIGYFEKLMTEFPKVRFYGMEGTSGKLSLLGTGGEIKNVKLKIDQDMAKISRIDVKMSVRQIYFLEYTRCKIVNDELKKEDAMLLLINVKRSVGAEALEAKIMSLKKCDDNEVIIISLNS